MVAQPGDLERLGPYRLIASLGHGGMADVYLGAVDGPSGSGFTKLVVLKKLRGHLADDPQFVAMLVDEARVTARLDHPNVVRLHELARDGKDYFLAMEYLDGQPLHRIERRAARDGVRIPPDVHYAIVADVLAGLHHAHELRDYDGTHLQIVHRDVTPSNIFVTYEGIVKVVDFGLAKAIGRATETQHGIRKGKIRYMSPEQAAGAPVDRATDIFAAGVILWNFATGRKFWAEKDDVEIAIALRDGNYLASPKMVCPGVPEEIDAICRRALAVHPRDRFPTADAMRHALEHYLDRRGVDARRTLAALMERLFKSDREKVRAVLENAALAKHASAGKLREAMRNARERRRSGALRTRKTTGQWRKKKRKKVRTSARVYVLSTLLAVASAAAAVAISTKVEEYRSGSRPAPRSVASGELVGASTDIRGKAPRQDEDAGAPDADASPGATPSTPPTPRRSRRDR